MVITVKYMLYRTVHIGAYTVFGYRDFSLSGRV